jgi:hypothetical protein
VGEITWATAWFCTSCFGNQLGSEVGGASAYPCSLHVPSSQDAGPMGDQNPKVYVHKGGCTDLILTSCTRNPWNS